MALASVATGTQSKSHISNRSAAFSLLFLGGMLVLIVGFAPISAIHNAAHDNRHTAAFPCH